MDQEADHWSARVGTAMSVPTWFLIAGLLTFRLPAGEAGAGAPYTIQRDGDNLWLTQPGGERFFSFGVGVVNQGAAPQEFDAANPGYAAYQYYENSNRWAAATLQRLQSWGFTTVGGWSDYPALRQVDGSRVAFIPVLAVGMSCGAPWRDMWDTNIIAQMQGIARDQILPLRRDPRVIGYYSDNEMGWWNAALFKLTLEQPPTSGQRRSLLQLLRETYHGRWAELLRDFEPEGAGSFADLDQRGMLYLRPGSQGIRTYRRFLGLMAARYYSLVREVIHTYDPRGLILGDRYQSFYYPEVAQASAAAVDADSSNLNAAWNDGTFPRYYLDTLHRLGGKALFVSEFYMAAQENRSGDENSHSDFPTVATQAERARGFRNTMTALLQTPYVVGADWFQYYDEPAHGRGDGENYDFGLVDIHDRPYEPLTAAARALDPQAIKSRPHPVRPDASRGVPPAPHDPLGAFTIRRALQDWDRERGFVKPSSEFPVADLYVCWDEHAVYLGLYAQDIVETAYYRNQVVPAVDRAQWIVSLPGVKAAIHARLGPGAPPECDAPAARLVNLSGINMNTRNVAAMEMPARLFGKSRFQAGDTIRFDSTFLTHCRANRVAWKGKFTLRE